KNRVSARGVSALQGLKPLVQRFRRGGLSGDGPHGARDQERCDRKSTEKHVRGGGKCRAREFVRMYGRNQRANDRLVGRPPKRAFFDCVWCRPKGLASRQT